MSRGQLEQRLLVLVTLGLVAFGLVMVYSATSAAAAGRNPDLIPMPNFAASLLARFGFLPGAPLTRDQWLMLQRDNVVSGANGLEAFGIRPTPIEAIAPNYLVRYRKHGRFNTGEQDNRAF